MNFPLRTAFAVPPDLGALSVSPPFRVFNFWHFSYNVSWCGSLWVHLVWGSLCVLVWTSVSFCRLMKFSTVTCWKKFSAPFSLSFWDPCDTNVRTLDVVPEASSTLLISFNSFFFLFFILGGFCSCLPDLSFVLLQPQTCCYFLQCIFYLFSCYFLTLSASWLKSTLFYLFFSRVRSASLWLLLWTVRLMLISVSFSSFSQVLFCYFVWNIFLSVHFAWLCVCFCVLGSSVTFPALQGAAYAGKVL